MSLYEFNYNFEYIINHNISINIIKCRSILNFSLNKKLIVDIIELINMFYSDIICNLNQDSKLSLIKRYSYELGYNQDYLCYIKPIKLYISTFNEYNVMNETILREAGFWGANPNLNMFIVNLEENIKIINSFYFGSQGIDKNKFIDFCEKANIFMILYHKRIELESTEYFNKFEKLEKMLTTVEDHAEFKNVLSTIYCDEFLKKKKESAKKREKKNKLFSYTNSQNKFVDDIISLSNNVIELSKCHKNNFCNIKRVGKSSLHIVTGDGFYYKINICIFDDNYYYFVDIKEQLIISKNDIIDNPAIEWILLVNFIEFHLRINFNIPSDINLKNQTSKYYQIRDKIMIKDESKEVNEKELKDLWSNGKLFVF